VRLFVSAALLALALASCAAGQVFSQRGFFETTNYIYPQVAPNDSGRLVSEELFEWDPSVKILPGVQILGSFAARFDSHRQFNRVLQLDWADHRLKRPSGSARRLSLLLHKGGWTFEGGRQFIRWGKADILNPTDRFAPKDFLNVIRPEFLGVTAVRATYERGSETFEVAYQPVFTPSRMPLINQRWFVLPPALQNVPITDYGTVFPQHGQAGVRWNHLGKGYEFSISYFYGYNHLPLYDVRLESTLPDPRLSLRRYHPQMTMYGGDFAIPFRWFTLKAEGGYFTSTTLTADEYVLYVIQAERQVGEWTFVGGYAGDGITRRSINLGFSPELGLAKTFLGKAAYTIDANRSVSFEGAISQNGQGGYGKFEYTQAIRTHWRVTAAFHLLAGQQGNFLGQYNHNSNFMLVARYSF
jgi:hypothetical protein